MNSDPSLLERDLSSLKAVGLNDAFLARLDAAANDTLTTLTPEEMRFEASLAAFRPASVSIHLTEKFESAVQGLPFPGTGKILRFPRSTDRITTQPNRSWYAAAAAVALFGGIIALTLPSTKSSPNIVTKSDSTTGSSTLAGSNQFIPASYDRGLSRVSDEGVVWHENKRPQSVVRVDYEENITLKDSSGRTFQVKQPRVQYLMVPAQTD